MGSENMESNVMLELAAEAFQARNFELAAEIYECQLQDFSDQGTHQDLLVKRADALAFGGKLAEAFEVYRQASALERLRPAQLETLTDCLIGSIRSKEGLPLQRCPQGQSAAGFGGHDPFTCRICLGFLYEPVTLPCGHSFCKKCLDREKKPACCRQCKDASKLADVQSYRVNVILSNLLSKWFPTQLLAVQLRHEGNVSYSEKKLEAALEKYNEAIKLAPRDYVLFSNRSQINSSLRNFEDALCDAEMACRIQPLGLKGHLRKAQALAALRKTEEALTEYLFCIALEPESKLAKSEAQKLLSDMFAPVPDKVQERIPDCMSLLSARVRLKGNALSTLNSNYSISTPRLYKDSVKRSATLNLPEKSKPPPSISSKKSGTINSFRCPCSENREKDESFCEVCHPPVVDRNFLLKRKYSSEDEDKVESNEGSYKHLKLETTLKEKAASWYSVVRDLIDAADLECSLCMRLFYEPVTTPCGHTFCLKCLERCLDHNAKCPLCKEGLSEYLAQRQYSKTTLMEDLIATYLPEELVERRKVYEEEMAELSNLNKNVPIFVCTMAFPTVPCPLHIFEPCYRLMIRRCMETGTKQFGMCISDSLKGFADYGCILEIRNVEFFPDGRSVVDTIGKRRFKVIQHGQRDGYNTADIEYLEDKKVEGEEETELLALHDAVYDQALTWINSIRPEQKERIIGHFGPMPEKDPEPQVSPNGPPWCWWLLAVLPLEERAQLPFLALTSLKDRLTGIRRVLMFMSRNRPR
ncbi:LON peptidase N-terminal domain and RING finger protein 3 [Lepisosteus oculatus]|uniref:LON peptidase N-terminal domain and RING finger protein 3 n=1 Tax=Lepisosteus oculatus TaxID=7918 RepID=UPI00073FB636|nr:PREDICTED: LON peptidase N-terminal domain and RING finger protein 3 [Lepisosteus oculatus]